jgi:ankyrin repeat protein
MSEHHAPETGGDQHALDTLRRHARQLLRRAQAGDPVSVGFLRGLLPRLAALDDVGVASSVQLADVQHAIARKMGHANWAAVKAMYESIAPIHRQAATFLLALQDGNLGKARELLALNPAIAEYSIHTASAVGHIDAVRVFLAADASLATARAPGNGPEPLLFAVEGDLKRDRGVSPDTHYDLVRTLLEAGADANASAPLPDVSDTIPVLYWPSVNGQAALVRLLLQHGARATDGESLYHAAQHDQRDCLNVLREFGADLSHGPTAEGNTPLHFLAAHSPENPITPTAMRGMAWLLEHGADPNVRSYPGRSGQPQAGETPLHRAAAVGHDAAVLQLLVTHGASVALQRDDGASAYQLAMRAGNVDAAAFLARVGADPALTDMDRLLAACLTNDAETARGIVAKSPSILHDLGPSECDALAQALAQRRDDTVRLMVSLGWPLTYEGEWGGTPLHWAAWNGYVDLVQLLVEAGAPVNQRDSRYGSSPIAWAAHGSRFCPRANDDDYPAIVHRLIDAGATRAESYNQWQEAPEDLARPSVVTVLRARGFAA